MDWKSFKIKSEKKFRKKTLWSNCYGFQIQPGTKWNAGLDTAEITALETLFGFQFPIDYKEMLLVMNGFDRDEISIDPNEEDDDKYKRCIYQYPEDFGKGSNLLDEIRSHIEYVKEPLAIQGYNTDEIVGFVPLYSHRALVVFNDTTLSPVISIHQGTDVIVYGNSLLEYWEKEIRN